MNCDEKHIKARVVDAISLWLFAWLLERTSSWSNSGGSASVAFLVVVDKGCCIYCPPYSRIDIASCDKWKESIDVRTNWWKPIINYDKYEKEACDCFHTDRLWQAQWQFVSVININLKKLCYFKFNSIDTCLSLPRGQRSSRSGHTKG